MSRCDACTHVGALAEKWAHIPPECDADEQRIWDGRVILQTLDKYEYPENPIYDSIAWELDLNWSSPNVNHLYYQHTWLDGWPFV